MAMIDVSPNWYVALAPLAGWPDRGRSNGLPGKIQQLAARFLTWRAQRETVRLLRRVDADTLRDLGISDIESQVYGDPTDRRRGYDPNWWRKSAR